MMRTVVMSLALVLTLAASARAQVQGGTVFGTIKDQQGGVLPGAAVTLTGTDRNLSFTTGVEGQYRFLNVPPGVYVLSATLQGVSTTVMERVVVAVGQNVEIGLSMRVASVQESVTVSGASPIVDAKAMGTATNFSQDELAKVPNSRDPWALLRTVPGLVVDRFKSTWTLEHRAQHGRQARDQSVAGHWPRLLHQRVAGGPERAG